MNNGLKAKECIVLVDSLQRHYSKLSILNLSKNKMGQDGAKHLAEAVKSMKVLSHLDLCFNEIGDAGISEIAKSLKEYSQVEYLDISGNCIGKSGSI